MGIPTLIDPRMLSQVGAPPPLQDTIKPSGFPPLPAPTVAPPMPNVPTGMGMDAMPPQVSAPPAQQPGFAQMLVKSIPMLLAGIAASKGGRPAMTGLLEGYTSSLERKRILDQRQHEFDVQQAGTDEDRQMRVQQFEAQNQARITAYLNDALNYLDKVDDPVTYKATVKLLDDRGVQAFGLPPGFMSNRIGEAFPQTKIAAKAERDAKTVMANAEKKYGDDLDAMIARGDTWKGPDGTERPLKDWAAMAGAGQAMGSDGQPIAATPRPKNEFESKQATLKAMRQQKERELGRPLTPDEAMALENDVAGKAAAATRATPKTHTTGMYQGALVHGAIDENNVFTPTRDAEGHVIRAVPTGTAAKDNSALVEAVIANPTIYEDLTPTSKAAIAGELQARGFAGFGKSMNESALTKIAESKSAITSLKDLRDVLLKNEQYIGPIAGLQAMNPYSDARKAQADIDRVKQRVGKALEGGVLRKEDEEKYKRILATLRDTPETAIYKVDQMLQNLEKDIETFIQTQKSGGRNTSGFDTPAKANVKVDGAAAPVRMTAPDGKSYDVPADKVAAARAKGWK